MTLRQDRNSTRNIAGEEEIRRIEIEIRKIYDLQTIVTSLQAQATALAASIAGLGSSVLRGFIWSNAQHLVTNTTIEATVNAMVVGPVTIDEGVTITVAVGATFAIL